MSKGCQRDVKGMSKVCQRYVKGMSKVCQRYVKGMPSGRGPEKIAWGGDKQTDRQTEDGHRDSMTESAKWVDSVKKLGNHTFCIS